MVGADKQLTGSAECQPAMSNAIYWFRSDLRLGDNPALLEACAASDRLLLVYVISSQDAQLTSWGFPRRGPHRVAFRDQALQGLVAEIARRGGELQIVEGPASQAIPELARAVGADRVFCETIAAPEEIAEVTALRGAGLRVRERWQSSLLEPADLPFAVEQLPEIFTVFRQAVERADLAPALTAVAPSRLPLAAAGAPCSAWQAASLAPASGASSFPFQDPAFHGSEVAALAHLERYFGSTAPRSYKATRNGLMGAGYSTKLSPWLAVGALSPRTACQYLKAHEARFGANDSTYWIWFELMWRDFFRFWSLKHGAQLFRSRGLGRQPPPSHHADAFSRWCAGDTGNPFVDAGMRELLATGFLSNRMRQIVASYLVHDLACDWRAGAAWFESRLIDYDVCSNQGNWLYIAGRGADPRQGRRFNPDKQPADHDPDGVYQALWSDAGAADLS
jgi:deoxyribodipyrimidine photo-lyase